MRPGPFSKLCAAAWLALGLACATPPAAPVETGQLFLWEIERPDGRGGVAHVLGSVHLSEVELRFDPAVEGALAGADTLVLEVAPEELDRDQLARLTAERGFYTDGRTLDEVLAPRTWHALEQRLGELELSVDAFRRMEPWLAMLTLQMTVLQIQGYEVNKGVETQLAASALETGKATEGLESAEDQIDLFDRLPAEVQEQLLYESLVANGSAASQLDVLLEAWRKGDDARLEEEVYGQLASDPALAPYYESFYFARNDRMARGIAERLDAGGRWFVAVGAAHVVGARGIPSLLAREGYRVRRVPKTR